MAAPVPGLASSLKPLRGLKDVFPTTNAEGRLGSVGSGQVPAPPFSGSQKRGVEESLGRLTREGPPAPHSPGTAERLAPLTAGAPLVKSPCPAFWTQARSFGSKLRAPGTPQLRSGPRVSLQTLPGGRLSEIPPNPHGRSRRRRRDVAPPFSDAQSSHFRLCPRAGQMGQRNLNLRGIVNFGLPSSQRTNSNFPSGAFFSL